MSKKVGYLSAVGSLAASLSVVAFGPSATGQECCQNVFRYEIPVVYSAPMEFEMMPAVNWTAEPFVMNEEFVSDPAMDEVVVTEPVVYEEQMYWNGCCWQSAWVAIPAMTPLNVSYPGLELEDNTHTVGRPTYQSEVMTGEVLESPVGDSKMVAPPTGNLNTNSNPEETTLIDSTKSNDAEIIEPVIDESPIEEIDGLETDREGVFDEETQLDESSDSLDEGLLE